MTLNRPSSAAGLIGAITALREGYIPRLECQLPCFANGGVAGARDPVQERAAEDS